MRDKEFFDLYCTERAVIKYDVLLLDASDQSKKQKVGVISMYESLEGHEILEALIDDSIFSENDLKNMTADYEGSDIRIYSPCGDPYCDLVMRRDYSIEGMIKSTDLTKEEAEFIERVDRWVSRGVLPDYQPNNLFFVGIQQLEDLKINFAHLI